MQERIVFAGIVKKRPNINLFIFCTAKTGNKYEIPMESSTVSGERKAGFRQKKEAFQYDMPRLYVL